MIAKIGDYKVYAVQTGLFKLDGGAMFGVVPKPLWTKTNPSDDQNRIDMCTRAMLLINDKKKILIDTGIGYKLSEKINKIYQVDFSEYTLEKSLEQLGYKREDITDVILTHLHFDHAGGNTYYDEDGQLKISYPNAVFHVQKEHYEWALNPTERDKASFFPENYVILDEKKVLNKISGKYKFDDHITLNPVYGHTKAMQLPMIADDKKSMLYLADLIPTAGHIPLPFIMGYDLFPLTTLEEKRKFLTDIADNKRSVFFEHDPHHETGKISLTEKGYLFSKHNEIDNELLFS